MPPYPRKLINEGETVVLDLKPHWFFFWKHIVAGADDPQEDVLVEVDVVDALERDLGAPLRDDPRP
jgi:hypothetical protein